MKEGSPFLVTNFGDSGTFRVWGSGHVGVHCARVRESEPVSGRGRAGHGAAHQLRNVRCTLPPNPKRGGLGKLFPWIEGDGIAIIEGGETRGGGCTGIGEECGVKCRVWTGVVPGDTDTKRTFSVS